MRRAVGDVSCAAGLCPSYPDIRAWAAGHLPLARLSLLTQVAQLSCCYQAGPRPKFKPNRGCTERPECLLITEKHLSVQLWSLPWIYGRLVPRSRKELPGSIQAFRPPPRGQPHRWGEAAILPRSITNHLLKNILEFFKDLISTKLYEACL